jgi:hypothetical protein
MVGIYSKAGDRQAHMDRLDAMIAGEIPTSGDSTSIWFVQWGDHKIYTDPNWRQRVVIRVRSLRQKASDAWAVFKGDKAAVDWDEI